MITNIKQLSLLLAAAIHYRHCEIWLPEDLITDPPRLDAKRHCEELDRLRNVAAEIVDEFQRRTKVHVSAVHIDLVHERAIGATSAKAIVSAARLSIEL